MMTENVMKLGKIEKNDVFFCSTLLPTNLKP